MGGGSHFALFSPSPRPGKIVALVVFAIILALMECNALCGTTGPGKKMLGSVKGTLWGGFVLTAVLVVVLKLIFRMIR